MRRYIGLDILAHSRVIMIADRNRRKTAGRYPQRCDHGQEPGKTDLPAGLRMGYQSGSS
jgi:hypothetical protein